MTFAGVHNHDIDPSCPEVLYDGQIRGACVIPFIRDIDRWDAAERDLEAVSHMESVEQARVNWATVYDEAMDAARRAAQLPTRREYHARHAAQPRGLARLMTVILGNVALTAAVGVLAGLSLAVVLAFVVRGIQS